MRLFGHTERLRGGPLVALRLRSVPMWPRAALGFAVALAAVTWPLLLRFGHATYGGPGDGWALIWQTRFRLENGVSYFSPTSSMEIAWPVGADLVTAILLSNAVVELPTFLLLTLGVGDVAAYNFVNLAGALGASLAMYALLRRLACRASVSFWGGLVYLIAPWHLVKLSVHPTLASMACFPLLLLGLHEWAHAYRLRAGVLLVGSFALATYTHGYYGLSAALVLIAAAPLVLLRAHIQGLFRRSARGTVLLAIALLLVPIPLGAALAVQSTDVSAQLDRPVYLIDLAARPYLWVLPHGENRVFGDLSRDYVEDHGLRVNDGELALYLGVLTLVLAFAGLIAAVKRQAPRFDAALAAVVALVGIAFSAPELVDLPLFGVVRAPVSYLDDLVGFVSAPARFFVLTLTGTVVLAALGLEALAQRVSGRWAPLAVAAACVVSALELPFFRDGRVVDTRATRLVAEIKRHVPKGAALAQYPSGSHGFPVPSNQLFYQLAHGHPLLAGAPAASTEDGVRQAVEDPNDRATPSKLALLGFKWATFDAGQADGAVYNAPPGLRVVQRLPDGSLLMRVVARPANALVGLGAAFTRVDRWMTARRATLAACATRAGRHTFKLVAAEFEHPRVLRIGDSPPFVVGSGPHEHRVPVTLREGWQEVSVELIGSAPTRPIDVLPGYRDERTLAVQIERIDVTGPTGPPRHCRRGPIPSD